MQQVNKGGSTPRVDHVLSAFIRAIGRREGWLAEYVQWVEHNPHQWLANEADKGYCALEAYMTGSAIPTSARNRLLGCLKDIWRTDIEDLYFSVQEMDDYNYFKWARPNQASLDELDGIVGAYNLCAPKASRKPLPSRRLSSIEQLRLVSEVHYSHSWQGPYKAALLLGQGSARCVEFSNRQPLYLSEPIQYRTKTLARDYMQLASTDQFVQILQDSVDPRDLTPLQRLMIEILPRDLAAAS